MSRVIGRGRCQVCGCTETRPCPGGCAWANADQNLCTCCDGTPWVSAEDVMVAMRDAGVPEHRRPEFLDIVQLSQLDRRGILIECVT